MSSQKSNPFFVIEGLFQRKPVTGFFVILLSMSLAACSVPGLTKQTEGLSPAEQTSSGNLPLTTSTEAPAVITDQVSEAMRSNLPDLGPAPELSNEVWLNTDSPLRLADLNGKVILLDMWTFG